MKKLAVFFLFLAALAGLTACKTRTIEEALSHADALITNWNSTNLNHYTYTASYQEEQNSYFVHMTIQSPASTDQEAALRSRDIVAASVSAIRPELEDCFRTLDEVDIVFAVYDEGGTLLYMFLNGAS